MQLGSWQNDQCIVACLEGEIEVEGGLGRCGYGSSGGGGVHRPGYSTSGPHPSLDGETGGESLESVVTSSI